MLRTRFGQALRIAAQQTGARTVVAPFQRIRMFSAEAAKEAKEETVSHDMVHFKTSSNTHPMGIDKHPGTTKQIWQNPMQHSVWSEDELTSIQKTHKEPRDRADEVALMAVRAARWGFDTLSFYKFGSLTKEKVLNRAIFLETVAGVPGMVAAMLRHLRSLRTMDRDHGWIHTLLEEAENERMHLLTFVKLRQPGWAFRGCVVASQGIFMNVFFFAYMVNPRICHRFVGYLEEEAVKTYTSIIEAIDDGRLKDWQTETAPEIAIQYWHMKPDATMRDMFLAIRADEASHRDVNHTLANLKPNETNPFVYDHTQPIQTPPPPAAPKQ